MKILLKDLPKISTNQIYAGTHWRARQKNKENYLWLTMSVMKKIPPIKNRCDLDFKFYFKKNALDSSNTSYMAKLIEDCLVEHGVLSGDRSKFIRKVSLESAKGEEEICELQIIEI